MPEAPATSERIQSSSKQDYKAKTLGRRATSRWEEVGVVGLLLVHCTEWQGGNESFQFTLGR